MTHGRILRAAPDVQKALDRLRSLTDGYELRGEFAGSDSTGVIYAIGVLSSKVAVITGTEEDGLSFITEPWRFDDTFLDEGVLATRDVRITLPPQQLPALRRAMEDCLTSWPVSILALMTEDTCDGCRQWDGYRTQTVAEMERLWVRPRRGLRRGPEQFVHCTRGGQCGTSVLVEQ